MDRLPVPLNPTIEILPNETPDPVHWNKAKREVKVGLINATPVDIKNKAKKNHFSPWMLESIAKEKNGFSLPCF